MLKTVRKVVVVVVVVAFPLLGLRVSSFFTLWVLTLHIVCSQLHSAFGGFMYVQYLYVSGPLDFCLVIQVLFGSRMILNACARRLDLGLTSYLNDAALPQV